MNFWPGHEVTHAFDNIGAQFDEIGNARNWWKNETKKHYNEKSQCMIKQYKDYELPNGLRINGDLTLKENVSLQICNFQIYNFLKINFRLQITVLFVKRTKHTKSIP